jgi:hypothetical protein
VTLTSSSIPQVALICPNIGMVYSGMGSSIESSTSGDGAFFEVATTIPFVAAKMQGVNT